MIRVAHLQTKLLLEKGEDLFLLEAESVDDEPSENDVSYNVFPFLYTDGPELDKPYFTVEMGAVSRKAFPGTEYEKVVVGFLTHESLVNAMNEHGFVLAGLQPF